MPTSIGVPPSECSNQKCLCSYKETSYLYTFVLLFLEEIKASQSNHLGVILSLSTKGILFKFMLSSLSGRGRIIYDPPKVIITPSNEADQ